MSPFDGNVPILWGDDRHDDARAIQLLLCGEAVYCMRSEQMIMAPTLKALPQGVYRVVPRDYDSESIAQR
jgi:hypothetical protein